ncbi:hypothetical protein NA57DRAFT_62021 [Rhizodiscina lignyota]|uniref:Uncharacterized protein n=1 Tax=Rhizodiscina lignyota TaxID=1504668 RepID=A0A9P4M4K4_9PEZI|nr:hypothetical protein NA57DRAFT_62021 [Rhizodiscina lignyota]
MSDTIANAATRVFNIPELLELILLNLPWDRPYEEIHSSRFIILSQSVSRTWQRLLHVSTPIRARLYLPCATDKTESASWLEKSAFPPAQPNPWTTFLLLRQRSWGTAYPFDNTYSAYNLDPSKPKLWTFALEISRAQFDRLPPPGNWRDMLLASPPFMDMWCTRAFYEMGSGRAPFVTYLDYQPGKPKWEQKYVEHRPAGITLGDVVDVVTELFAKTTSNYVKWVRIESVRRPPKGREADSVFKDAMDGMPKTRSLLPMSSAMLWSEHYGAS